MQWYLNSLKDVIDMRFRFHYATISEFILDKVNKCGINVVGR